jgi:hypothetical protein
LRARTLTAYAIIVPLMATAHAVLARAEILVEGSISHVRVHAQDAVVADVLAALAARFGLRVRGTVGDRRISADLTGPLGRVVARVLDGYDYVIRTRGDGMEVTVLGTASAIAVPAPIYRAPTYPAAKLRRDE